MSLFLFPVTAMTLTHTHFVNLVSLSWNTHFQYFFKVIIKAEKALAIKAQGV